MHALCTSRKRRNDDKRETSSPSPVHLGVRGRKPEEFIKTANQLTLGAWNSPLDDIYSENFLAAAVVETLLHSSPDIKSYLDYGLEVRGQLLAQTGWEDSQLDQLTQVD